MRAVLVLSLSVAAVVCLMLLGGAGHSHATAGSGAYLCEYPKDVTISGRTVSTPTICIPFP